MTVVVKLGGSLAIAGSLRSWIETISRHGRGRCVVVPGGGVFADAVRAAQRRFEISDRAAHLMALLAMEQYAEMLVDLAPAWRPCTSAGDLRAVVADGGIGVWLPRAMVASASGIAASWNVTSDSLAAWLARRLEAKRLVLVKSAPPPPPPLSPARLAEAGLVDPAFPVYATAVCELDYCGPGDERRLAAALGVG